MKKTLIALAAVAATSAAFAQSSVTVYGKLDVGLTERIGSDQVELREAAGNRLGFRGTEDLGGGLKANFVIEHRFNADTGAISNTDPAQVFWQGRSTVGLSGGFGKVDFGRDYSAAFWTASAGDVFGYDGVAANVSSTNAGTNPTRLANGIFYTSPTMGGFVFQGTYALKEGAAKNATSVRVAYAAGPLSASIAATKNTNDNDYTGIGAAYDFGVAKANVLVTKGETAAGVESDGVTLGLVVPMGALTLKASYATLEVADVKTVSQLGLGARYALSKRTDVYTSFARNSKAATEKSGWEIGVQHNF
jgi:predicted porin